MLIIRSSDEKFPSFYSKLRGRGERQSDDVELLVKDILDSVRSEGDAALLRFTEKYDGHVNIEVTQESIRNAYDGIGSDLLSSLETAYTRIEEFHCAQQQNSWIQTVICFNECPSCKGCRR